MQGAFINDLGFLSLGLRAVTLLLPLSFALWLPDKFKPRYIIAGMIAGTIAMLLAQLLHLPSDPMYYGLLSSALVFLIGIKKS